MLTGHLPTLPGIKSGMAESDPFRHVPDSIKDAIPDSCVGCPALLGSLTVHNAFIDSAIAHQKRTWNPFAKLGLFVSKKLSEAKLYGDMHERIPNMYDCAGTIEYPAHAVEPENLCGIGIRDALSEQVTNQQLRTE